MSIEDYVAAIQRRLSTGIAREHAYRGDLQLLLESLMPDLDVTNEPREVTDAGNPDFVVTRENSIPVGFLEAKDVGKNLDHKQFREQFERYRLALENLIITNYLQFNFYQNGELIECVELAQLDGGNVRPNRLAWERFALLMKEFSTHVGQSISSAKKLAVLMADKAKLLQDTIGRALDADLEAKRVTDLSQQFKTFKEVLIHDLTPHSFSDLYAQTLAYGLFAARLHDDTLEDFSRKEAAELIPQSNPFLRRLFGYVAGPDIDKRIERTVDNLAGIFLRANVRSIMEDVGKKSRMGDAVIHFYETFLAEYNPALRKARGVWYTPRPVVQFIVRAVDDLLKACFSLPRGLSDQSKVEVRVKNEDHGVRGAVGKTKTIKRKYHRVQILDPATGTGTFLAGIIEHVHETAFKGAEGSWPKYVDDHLLPRLNGFELLMAPYAMAHLKLDLLLASTGVRSRQGDRTQVYLTNSLEEYHPDTGTLFAAFLSAEANAANTIKRDTPVMCVIGNPPYSGISTNNGDWISRLIDDYKYVDGKHFGERKHWLNDDYVKFIRMGEELVARTGEGILAYINNHSFIDNPTFRGMRRHLLETFDTIYIIDLHGNSKKKERCPDGSRDVNVFDIQAGVSINLFVRLPRSKAKAKSELAEVRHIDVFGERIEKYELLEAASLKDMDFTPVTPKAPFYFFKPTDHDKRRIYDQGIRLCDLMPFTVAGIVTARDAVVLGFDEAELLERIERFCDSKYSDEQTRQWLFPGKRDGKYKAGDSRGWSLERARVVIAGNDHSSLVRKFDYRPFDQRYIYYSPEMVDWGREDAMRNLAVGGNLAMVVPKINKEELGAFVTRDLAGHKLYSAYDSNSLFPLFLIDPQLSDSHGAVTRRANLDPDVLKKLSQAIGLPYDPKADSGSEAFTPIDVFDYVYGALNDPSYIEEFSAFLKVDFPKVPLPGSAQEFWDVGALGKRLRLLHLLEDYTVHSGSVSFPVAGSGAVTRKQTIKSPGFELVEDGKGQGRVWINDEQYFDHVPHSAYELRVGGFQPAKKWLSDRVGRVLELEDVRHFQALVTALEMSIAVLEQISDARSACMYDSQEDTAFKVAES